MNEIENILKEIDYTIVISVITGSFTILWTVYQYIDTKKREQNLNEFENYHKLIKELVQPEVTPKGEDVLYVDRQAAIIYELRHFKRYYELSYRTLKGLKEKWEKVPNQFPRLIEEINLSLEFLEKKI
jgi:hypothetical protein